MTHPSDKELDDYLRRDSQVSESYRMLDVDDVPPVVDAAVMAKAREAVATPAKSKQRTSAWMRWSSPLALAASAVLVVAIVLEVGVQDELRLPAPQLETSVSEKKVEAPAASADSTEARVDKGFVDRPLESIAPAAPVVAPVPAQQPERYAAVPSSGASSSFANEPQPAPSALKLEQPRQAVSAAPPPPPAAGISDRSIARADAQAQAQAQARQRSELEQVVVTGQRVSSQPQDTPMPVSALDLEEVLMTGSKSVSPTESNDRTRPSFGPRAPGAPRPAQTASKENADAESGQSSVYPTPESWLDAIRKLRADGKTAEADEQWRLFRREYPNYRVRAGDAAMPAPQR